MLRPELYVERKTLGKYERNVFGGYLVALPLAHIAGIRPVHSTHPKAEVGLAHLGITSIGRIIQGLAKVEAFTNTLVILQNICLLFHQGPTLRPEQPGPALDYRNYGTWEKPGRPRLEDFDSSLMAPATALLTGIRPELDTHPTGGTWSGTSGHRSHRCERE